MHDHLSYDSLVAWSLPAYNIIYSTSLNFMTYSAIANNISFVLLQESIFSLSIACSSYEHTVHNNNIIIHEYTLHTCSMHAFDHAYCLLAHVCMYARNLLMLFLATQGKGTHMQLILMSPLRPRLGSCNKDCLLDHPCSLYSIRTAVWIS